MLIQNCHRLYRLTSKQRVLKQTFMHYFISKPSLSIYCKNTNKPRRFTAVAGSDC